MTRLQQVQHDLKKDFYPSRRPYLLELEAKLIRDRDAAFREDLALAARYLAKFAPVRWVQMYPDECKRCVQCQKLIKTGSRCAACQFVDEI